MTDVLYLISVKLPLEGGNNRIFKYIYIYTEWASQIFNHTTTHLTHRSYICIHTWAAFFPPNLILTFQYMLLLQRCQPLNDAALRTKRESVCFELKIDLQPVLFHSICRRLSRPSEEWRALHLLCLLWWVGWGLGVQFTRYPSSHSLVFCLFLFSFPGSLNLVFIIHCPPA